MTKISIIVPVYNEQRYIGEILRRLLAVEFADCQKEIIVVDDGSTDQTTVILENFKASCQVITKKQNEGKGAALRTGFAAATGEIIAIQDADLEYNPNDLPALVAPVLAGRYQVVYGSRMIGQNPIGHIAYYLGNKLISWGFNRLYRSNLSDIETGYKVFLRQLLSKFVLESNDFGFEIELTAKILKNQIPILELPISYSPRQFKDGKKIRSFDGLKALWLLVRYYFS